MAKKSFLNKVSDISKIHHRAAFTGVKTHISKLNLRTHFAELAAERFSCRSYSARAVSGAKVDKILNVARIAPSAKNLQPVHVWAVTSADALARLHEVHTAFKAPVVFMVGYKADDAWVRGYDKKNNGEIDASIVATHIILEATDLGLGTVWIGSFDPAKIAEQFPETEGYEVMALIAAGHPAADAEPSVRHGERKPAEEFSTIL